MKYGQSLVGLLVGTVLGASALTLQQHWASKSTPAAAPVDTKSVAAIVRSTLMEDPQIIIDAVEKYKTMQQKDQVSGTIDALKKPAIRSAVYADPEVPFIGPKDAKNVVVEFFDYNCPACKMQFGIMKEFVAKHPDVKVVFHEYPIFGPVSEVNAGLALAVFHQYPEKYFAFHSKMMEHQGKVDEKLALSFIAGLGMDVKKLQAYAASDAIPKALNKVQKLGEALQLRGTPSVFIGDHFVPHVASLEELEAGLSDAR